MTYLTYFIALRASAAVPPLICALEAGFGGTGAGGRAVVYGATGNAAGARPANATMRNPCPTSTLLVSGIDDGGGEMEAGRPQITDFGRIFGSSQGDTYPRP